MKLIHDLIGTISEGVVQRVNVGVNWTAVVMEVGGARYCGLASTLSDKGCRHDIPDFPDAGQLESLSGRELAQLSLSNDPMQISIGLAAINALLSSDQSSYRDGNAGEIIAKYGLGKRVVVVGHFPFVDRLRSQVSELIVLEQHPRQGDHPASAAPEVIPHADVIAITALTISNRTMEDLITLCSSDSIVILVGPSTPLSPVLFDHRIDILCGSIVDDIQPVLRVISQGGNFRQMKKAGVRLVVFPRPGIEE